MEAGRKGRAKRDKIQNSPATNAMKKETVTAKSAVRCLLNSIIFCSPIGNSDCARTETANKIIKRAKIPINIFLFLIFLF